MGSADTTLDEVDGSAMQPMSLRQLIFLLCALGLPNGNAMTALPPSTLGPWQCSQHEGGESVRDLYFWSDSLLSLEGELFDYTLGSGSFQFRKGEEDISYFYHFEDGLMRLVSGSGEVLICAQPPLERREVTPMLRMAGRYCRLIKGASFPDATPGSWYEFTDTGHFCYSPDRLQTARCIDGAHGGRDNEHPAQQGNYYLFGHSLFLELDDERWLAQIWHRQPDGHVTEFKIDDALYTTSFCP